MNKYEQATGRSKLPTYTIKGYSFDNDAIEELHYHTGVSSLLDFQRDLYNNEGIELDEHLTIEANYHRELTDVEAIEVKNEFELMDTPLQELFKKNGKLDRYLEHNKKLREQ